MSRLTLVRHGQASYLEDVYDRLSPLGEQQAGKLGEYWAARGIHFDRVIYGPAERHGRTGEIAGEVLRGRGRPWPEPRVIPELDEFDGERMVRTFAPILAARDGLIRQLLDACDAAPDLFARKSAVDRLFHEVARRWVDGEVTSGAVESWEHFTGRVRAGIAQVTGDLTPEDRAVVFTSAGPTAVTISLALRISPRDTLELAFRPRNASYSELTWKNERLALDSFNAIPHLDDPALWTYR